MPQTPGGEASPLRFGVTAAGRVYGNQPDDNDPAEDLAAVEDLAGGRPFVVRMNRVLFSEGAAAIKRAQQRARVFTAEGFEVALQLRYGAIGWNPDPARFERWVRLAVRVLGRDEGITTFEVTNEPNLRGAPDNSDGSFPGVIEAMVRGIAGGKDEAGKRGFDHIRFGFNWYYPASPADDAWFWAELAPHAVDLSKAIDWVGMNVYPGTYDGGTMPTFEGGRLVEGLDLLRNCYLPFLDIAREVPIRIVENGYPSSAGRPEVLQARALETMARAAHDHAATYNVSDYGWFTLRDVDSGSTQHSDTFGLLKHDYSPKASFAAYAAIIEELSVDE